LLLSCRSNNCTILRAMNSARRCWMICSAAREFARTPLLCYVNNDIILLHEFIDAVSAIHAQFPKFLGVAHRLNIELQESLDFAADGESKLRREIVPVGVPGNPTAIEVFVFSPDVYEQIHRSRSAGHGLISG
jgi:hypothetical protein